MPSRNKLPIVWRLLIAAALAAWLAVAAWLFVVLARAEPVHRHSPFSSLGELLGPALLLGAAALLFVLIPRRLVAGWGFVLIFALAGIPAWLFLGSGAYAAVPSVPSEVVTACRWLTLGLVLGLVVLSLIELRGVGEPLETLEVRPGMGGVVTSLVEGRHEDGSPPRDHRETVFHGLPSDRGDAGLG